MKGSARGSWPVAFMYIFCVLVWGTSNFAYRPQIAQAPSEHSLLFRLLLAFFVVSAIRAWKKDFSSVRMNFSAHFDHLCFGILNLVVSYLFLYKATALATSGLVTLIFSCKAILTPCVLDLLGLKALQRRFVVAFVVSMCGVAIITVHSGSFDMELGQGILYALSGTAAAAAGDAFSARVSAQGSSPYSAVFWALFYGCITCACLCVASPAAIHLPTSWRYWTSVGWLGTISSVAAWLSYMKLITSIGADRASFMVLLFPVVGLVMSITTNELLATANMMLGAVLITFGNGLVFAKNVSFKIGVVSSVSRDEI